MINRIKRWLRVEEYDERSDEVKDMDEKLRAIGYEPSPELEETQRLLRDSQRKSKQASERLSEYQDRIAAEYEKRAAIAGAGRGDNEPR